MTTRIFTDRSRIETYQSCARRRWLEYHQSGLGITSVKKSLPLAVGGAVHVGLETLLREGQKYLDSTSDAFSGVLHDTVSQRSIEQSAVDAAAEDFIGYSGHLDIPTETAGRPQQDALSEIDEYLYREQSSLVEGLVRAYARRRLKPLLTQYEVLEVEREGEWTLAELEGPCNHVWHDSSSDASERLNHCPLCDSEAEERRSITHCNRTIEFMSRPDALLRDRESNQLYLLSFKTTGSWDHRKEKDAQHDMQGLSEGVEVERRLGEWWKLVRIDPTSEAHFISGVELPWTIAHRDEINRPMTKYLAGLSSPPRILGIRYEYLLKGERWKDSTLSAKFQTDVWSQRSHLVRGYLYSGMASGDEQWNWSFSYLKPDGSKSKLYAKYWPSTLVTDHMTIREWIEWLDQTESVHQEDVYTVDGVPMGTQGEQGWKSPVQATGTTTDHPLDAVFIPPFIVYRSDDDLRDLIEQIEAQERRVADGVAEVNAATDEGERRSVLNRHFAQSRKACSFPWPCAMIPICYGGEEIRRAPLASGLYTIRTVNHPVEIQGATDETRPR